MEAERKELMRLMIGPWLARAVATATELGVVERLDTGPAGCEELAEALSLDPESLLRLLRLLTALGVLREEGGRFEVTEMGTLLRRDHPSSMRDLALLYDSDSFTNAWTGLGEAVRTGEQAFSAVYGQEFYTYLADHPRAAAQFDAGMSAGGSFVTPLPSVYDFSSASRVVDVGGGDGTLLAAVLRAYPHLHGVLCERDGQLHAVRDKLGSYVDAGRCELVACDFHTTVPAGGDVYMLSRVLHNWDDDSSREVLARCREAMGPRGRLLILERVVPQDRHPWLTLAFDLHMLVMTGGRERTASEYEALLRPAGLRTLAIHDLPMEVRALVAAPR